MVKKRVAHSTASDRVKCPRIVPTQITMRSVKDALCVSCSMMVYIPSPGVTYTDAVAVEVMPVK